MIEPPPVDPSEPETRTRKPWNLRWWAITAGILVGPFVIAGVFGDIDPEPAADDSSDEVRQKAAGVVDPGDDPARPPV